MLIFKWYFLLSVLVAGGIAAADNGLVRNGSFETIGPDGVPVSWQAGINRNAPVVFSVSGRSLRVINQMTKPEPHVLGMLSQAVAVPPDTDCLFRFKARGVQPQSLFWTFGKQWKIRYPVRNVSSEWREFSYRLRIAAADLEPDGNCMIRLVSDGNCPDLYITDVELIPAPPVIVWNSAFEGQAGKIPEEWTNLHSGNAKYSGKLDGNGVFHMRNQSSKAPNVFGGLLQRVKLTPGAPYRAVIRVRGDGAGPTLILGKRWLLRINVEPLLPEWQEYEYRFTAPPPTEVDADGFMPLVIISQDVAEIEIDRLDIEAEEYTPPTTAAESTGEFHARQNRAVAGLLKKLEQLNREFDTLYGDQPRNGYVSMPLAILNDRLPRLAQQLAEATDDGRKRFYANQAAMTHREIGETLEELEHNLEILKNGKKPPESWSFRSSAIRLEKGWPVALAVNSAGQSAERPIVCVGYGHFEDITRNIEKFQHMAANTVQVEIGPRHLFPREGVVREFEPDYTVMEKWLLPLMKRAWDSNVKIILLISPHYIPEWLMKKYPNMESKPAHGFFHYELTHPKARECLQFYVRALVERLKADPYAEALHSICLANEPNNSVCVPQNPDAATRFQKYLKGKYGDVVAFNAAAKRNYGGFEELPVAVEHDKAAKYEFGCFSRRTLTDWHRMLADEIRNVWPELPVHTKIMAYEAGFDVRTGVDPEALAEFSGYNGNDNFFYEHGRWAASWNETALMHEVQISSKPVSVVNSENHIIPDRATQPISNDHVYTALFQQFVTGASSLITWVYADITYDFANANPRHGLLGNIYGRPGNLAAQGRAVFDGMRLAPELRKFMQYEPEVAVLYSPTSVLLETGRYKSRFERLYLSLCSSGRRVRTLSEKQLTNDDFGRVKILLVAGAVNLTDAAASGIKRFTERGGVILVDEISLQENEYGNPLSCNFTGMRFDSPAAAEAQIDKVAETLPVRLEHGDDSIFFRMVPDCDGSWLVNLVNYDFKPRRLSLTGRGNWFDLIGEREFLPEFELAPLKPLLLRFIPACNAMTIRSNRSSEHWLLPFG